MNYIFEGIIYFPYNNNEAIIGTDENNDGNAVVGTLNPNLSFLREVPFNGVKRKVTTVGNYAFRQNKDITSIFIHRNIRELKTWTFDWCSNVVKITFENNSELKILGPSAFNNCPITHIVLPSSISKIGGGAFGHNNKIESLVYCGKAFIPKGLGIFYQSAVPVIYVCYDYRGNTFDGEDVIRLGRQVEHCIQRRTNNLLLPVMIVFCS